MGFFLILGLWIGTMIIGRLLSPRTNTEGPKPGEITVPTIDESRPIPVAYGRVLLRGLNVVWWGDVFLQPIKVSGGLFAAKQRIGFRYSVGLQETMCLGPLDELVQIRFDDRQVPLGQIVVNGSNNILGFRNVVPPTVYAAMTPGTYTSMGAVAKAAYDAMVAAAWGFTTKVSYCYEVVAGYTDQIAYAVNVSGSAPEILASLIPGHYPTAQAFGAEVARALNASEAAQGGGARVSFAVTYDGSRFTITATMINPNVIDWRIRGATNYELTAYSLLGFQRGAVVISGTTFPASLVADYVTYVNRFVFDFGGHGGKLMLTDPAFNSASLFGWATAADPTVESYCGISDRIMSGVTIGDAGDYYLVSVVAPELFGGEADADGGVVGTFYVYKGTLTQVANPYLTGLLGPIPAYRGVSYLVGARPYMGNSAFLKNISAVVGVHPNELGTAGKHNVGTDANPICAIYQILTNTRWGRGIAPASIDTASFLAAADTIFTEGLGFSFTFDQTQPAADMISEILRHVDGVMYTDPTTGLLKIKLARADYVVGTLPSFTVDDLTNIKLSRPSWGELRNMVRIKYVDRGSDYTERIATAQDLAQIQARGGEISAEDFDFRGISNATNAQKVAARVLRSVSYPLAVVQLTANREAYALRPGDVFKLTSAPLGITDMVCRVTRIRTGDLLDGTISIDAVEDIFAITWTAYTPPPASGWVDPFGASATPAQAQTAATFETPYPYAGGANRYITTMATKPLTGLSTGYEVWTDVVGGTGPYNYAKTNDVTGFTPKGTLNIAMGYVETTINVVAGPDMASLVSVSDPDFAAGVNICIINSEIIAWKSIVDNGNGSYTIGGLMRGCMDTVPAPHVVGANVWFLSAGRGFTNPDSYPGDLTVHAKMLPRTSGGVADINGATDSGITTNSRTLRPYVPRNVQLNGVSYPTLVAGALTVSWAHRNRLGAWTYADGGLAAAVETGCTYTLRLYGTDGLLKKTYTGLTGTSQVWTTEAADSGGVLNDSVRVELECVNAAAQTSIQMYNFQTYRASAALTETFPQPMPPETQRQMSLSKIGRRRAMRIGVGQVLTWTDPT